MVRHDMQAEKSRLTSDQIRLSLGIEYPKEKAAREKAEAERAAKKAKAQTQGIPLGFNGGE